MAINLKAGRYAVSRIVTNARGGLTTSAMLNHLATEMENIFPPKNTIPYALVWLGGTVGTPDADTVLLPNLALAGTPSVAQRNVMRTAVSARLGAFSYTDYQTILQNIAAFDTALITTTTTLSDILQLLLSYLQHSESRTRAAQGESHNTEYTDNFDSDPTSRWTYEAGSGITYDSGNNEMDFPQATSVTWRYNTSPGSIEHEAQGTQALYAYNGLAACRMASGANSGYYIETWPGPSADFFWLSRLDDTGTYSQLAEYGNVGADETANFWTGRIAASGAAGANVVVNIWYLEHTATKPSDPGWIGVDGSPNKTYTDTSAERLDGSGNTFGGVITYDDTTSDNRFDFFKVRAISDRGGAVTTKPWYVLGWQ